MSKVFVVGYLVTELFEFVIAISDVSENFSHCFKAVLAMPSEYVFGCDF